MLGGSREELACTRQQPVRGALALEDEQQLGPLGVVPALVAPRPEDVALSWRL
jgi:hypothetical protein